MNVFVGNISGHVSLKNMCKVKKILSVEVTFPKCSRQRIELYHWESPRNFWWELCKLSRQHWCLIDSLSWASCNTGCHYISKQQGQMVQIFACNREYLGTFPCSGLSMLKLANLSSKYWLGTLEICSKISWSSCHRVPNELSNFLLLDSKCQPKCQCSSRSLQTSRQKNIRFDCRQIGQIGKILEVRKAKGFFCSTVWCICSH